MNYSGTGRARQMEFLASRRASVCWTPMDYAGWAVTINKLRCIWFKDTLIHIQSKERKSMQMIRRGKKVN